jgi:hypothetical protein
MFSPTPNVQMLCQIEKEIEIEIEIKIETKIGIEKRARRM